MKVTETYMVVVDADGKPVHETLTVIPKEKGLSVDKAEGIAYVRSTEMFVMILNEMMKMPKPSIIQMSNMWAKMEKAGYAVHKVNVTFETVGEPLNSVEVSKKVLADLPTELRDIFDKLTKSLEQGERENLYAPPSPQRPKREEFRQKNLNTPFDGLSLN